MRIPLRAVQTANPISRGNSTPDRGSESTPSLIKSTWRLWMERERLETVECTGRKVLVLFPSADLSLISPHEPQGGVKPALVLVLCAL